MDVAQQQTKQIIKRGADEPEQYGGVVCEWCGTHVQRPYDTAACARLPFIEHLCDATLCGASCLYSAAVENIPVQRAASVRADLRALLGVDVHIVAPSTGRVLDACEICGEPNCAPLDLAWVPFELVRQLRICSIECAERLIATRGSQADVVVYNEALAARVKYCEALLPSIAEAGAAAAEAADDAAVLADCYADSDDDA